MNRNNVAFADNAVQMISFQDTNAGGIIEQTDKSK